MEDVLERLEEQEQEVERLLHELDLERRQTHRLRTDVESREQTLVEAERTAEGRARADARQLLMDARAEVESVIADLRAAAEEGRDLEEAARSARQRVERSASRQQQAGAAAKNTQRERRSGSPKAHATAIEGLEGAHVLIRSTGAKGLLVERRGERVLVEVGALRFEVPCDDVEPVDAPIRQAPKQKAGAWIGPPQQQARLEIDLRGLRVDEMDLELRRGLDQAVLDDLEQLRIIHGMGTGALRKRVGEILKMDRRVSEFRMGGPGEGGSGVTVATFGGHG